MSWRCLAASLFLAACVPQLTGAPCHEDNNCPVNQYCNGAHCLAGPPPATRVIQVVVTTPAGILPLGATVQANASAVLQSGAEQDVTSSATWTSSDARVAQVSDEGAVLAVATGEVDVTAVFGTNSGSAHLVVTDAQLVSVVVTVDRPVVAPRTDVFCTAVGFFTDGTHADLSSLASWTSTQPAVVSVSTNPGSVGALVALSAGTAQVTANYQQLTGSTSITVTDASLVGVSITPLLPWVSTSTNVSLQATGLFSDGTAQPMTGSVQWTVDDPSLAFFLTSHPGELQGFFAGDTEVEAQAGAFSADAPLVVSGALLGNVSVSPLLPDSVGIGASSTFTAWGTYADQGVLDLSAQASWSSSSPDVLAVLPGSGAASALDAGVAKVEVAFSGVTASAFQTVVSAAPSALLIWPPTTALTVGLPGALVAERVLANGTVDDVTQLAGWNSSCPAQVQVTTASPGGALVARSAKSCTASAKLSGLYGAASVEAVSRAVQRLEVSPLQTSIGLGGWVALTATAVFVDGTLLDVTSLAAWTSSAEGLVVAGNGTQAGQALAADAGFSQLTATFGGSAATAAVNVDTEVPLLEVWPPMLQLHAGTQQTLHATAVWPQGDAVDVTTWTVFASTNAAVAGVANASGARGLLAGLTAGSAEVTALFGAASAHTSVSVDAPTPQALALSGPSSFPAGEPANFQVAARYSDGSQMDVTSQSSWTSSAISVLRLRGAGPTRGAAIALSVGSAQAEARFGAVSGSIPVVTTEGGLQALSIQGLGRAVPAGVQLPLSAIASYPNGIQLDVTSRAVWTSLTPEVASISNGPHAGLLDARVAGSSQLTASFEGIEASASLVVSSAVLSGLTLLPGGPSGPVGVAVPLRAQGNFTDGSHFDLTQQARWTSANSLQVAVSNAEQSRGTAMALAPVTSTVSASVPRPDGSLVTGSVSFVGGQPSVLGVEISPGTVTLSLSGEDSLTLQATAHLSDGTTRDVSAEVGWSVQSSAVAKVTAAGALTGVKVGVTNVLAQLGAMVGSAPVSVGP
jgi:Bacterial Ig-like domain (group 2)